MARPSNPRAGRAKPAAPVSETTPTPSVVPLHGSQERYRVTAVLAAKISLGVEQLAQLYWGVQMLDPMRSDFDDEVLVAHFERHAPSAEVAAWAIAAEVWAVPGTNLLQVEAGQTDSSTPELVLLRDVGPSASSMKEAA